ncbi:hypothetical protein ACFQZ4_37225 [Catellatospora coxensis]|uniref:DUF2306 domain-containing protein n=1 Tax=Catellatospora coxensis TaxID=310354 RepID=A0A8J3KZ46_9ACTN|nr:hypothetical protein [Catellatospora coxensis]GIG03765.1 hypothetical protein Cco03nite_04650 [Catellatospora coxensis]
MVVREILGLLIPDEGAVFYAALAVHVTAGMAAVVAGGVAASARKRPGRHPRTGTAYLWALGVVAATAAMMTAFRPREDIHLLAIAVIAFSLALFGRAARRRRGKDWPTRHAIGMGGSYIALLTGFYVDNGSQLPLWDRLPHLAYWTLPTAVGIPLIWWALRRFRTGISARPRAAEEPGAPHLP